MERQRRKRTANFTAEEKLRLVRLLCEEGQCIISKVTAHDTATNKAKEQAWAKITQIHNSSGDIMRTTETLKKIWGKLKSDAKTFKAANRRSVSGTGGGPSKNFDDPLMELVANITGRASTGILDIDDCDAVTDEVNMREKEEIAKASPPIEYLDDSIFMEDFPKDKIITINEDQIKEDNHNTTQESSVNTQILKENNYKNEKQTHKITLNENHTDKKGKEWANRRRPQIDLPNEKIEKIKSQQRITNRFAAERLRAEQEKTNLIIQEKKQSAELHSIKMENEKLKKEFLQTLLKKVTGPDWPYPYNPFLSNSLLALYPNLYRCSDGSVLLDDSCAIASWRGPTPTPGTGPHRYLIYVFEQNGIIDARDEALEYSATYRVLFNLTLFNGKYNLFSPPVAGNFFYSEYPPESC